MPEAVKIYSEYAIQKVSDNPLTSDTLQDIAEYEYKRVCRGNYRVVSTSDMWPYYNPFLKVSLRRNEEVSPNDMFVLVGYNPRMDRDFVYIWGFTSYQQLTQHLKSSGTVRKYQMHSNLLQDPVQLLKDDTNSP